MSSLKVKWLDLALDDFDAAIEYIAKENPSAAQRVAQRIWNAGQALGENPEMGRLGRVKGSREWVVTRTPYLLAYRTKIDRVEIMRVLHAKQSWPQAFE